MRRASDGERRQPRPAAGRAAAAEPAGGTEPDRPLQGAGPILDAAGLALLGAGIAWVCLAASVSHASAAPVVAILLLSAAAWTAGRLTGSVAPWLVPGVVVLAAAALALRSPAETLSRAPLSGPFGYVNATSALFVQATAAGLMIAVGSRRLPGRVIGLSAAAAFAALPFAMASRSGAVLVALTAGPVVAMVLRDASPRAVRATIAGCGALVVLALAASIVLGAAYGRGPAAVNRAFATALSDRRLTLWHEALVIMAGNPVAGVGPGGFRAASPTALSDADARWAHQGFLQYGAETGVLGLVLLALTFVWGFARLLAGNPDRIATAGAAALAALGVAACADYVLHFPALPAAAAALAGAGAAPRPRLRTQRDDRGAR